MELIALISGFLQAQLNHVGAHQFKKKHSIMLSLEKVCHFL